MRCLTLVTLLSLHCSSWACCDFSSAQSLVWLLLEEPRISWEGLSKYSSSEEDYNFVFIWYKGFGNWSFTYKQGFKSIILRTIERTVKESTNCTFYCKRFELSLCGFIGTLLHFPPIWKPSLKIWGIIRKTMFILTLSG